MARRSTQKPKATDKDRAAEVAESKAAADTAPAGAAAAPTGARDNASADAGGATGKDTQGAGDAGNPAEAHAATPADQPQEQPGGGDDGHALAPAGDQDQAEAAAAAIISGAGETTSKPEETGPAVDLVVRITGPKKGRWRIGRRFDRTPVEIPVSEITGDQAEALKADKTLTIEIVPAS